jgi:hypothetical protein
MGIQTSRDPDTPKGLESQLSIRICRILTKVQHSTEVELGKLHQIRMDSGRAIVLELL